MIKGLRYKFILVLCLVGLVGSRSSQAEGEKGIYQVFENILEAKRAGRTPYVILDFDDFLSQTATRYLLSLEEINREFSLGLDPAQIKAEDIQYVNSFAETIKLTLRHLRVAQAKVDEIFFAGTEKQSPGEKTFLKVFFDPKNVAKDFLYPGARFFLSNLLSLAQKLDGKVVIASGRNEKWKDITKASLVYSGIPPVLLEGKHLIWYLKPEPGHIIESEFHLDFHNDKGKLIEQIHADSRNEVVGAGENEFRNIIQFINRLAPSRIFYFQSVDATWSDPRLVQAERSLRKDIGASRMGYTPIESFVVTIPVANWIRSVFKLNGVSYLNRAGLKQCGVSLSQVYRNRAKVRL